MKIENVKHLKLTLEIAARGDYCDVSCPFLRKDHAFGACRLFGVLREGYKKGEEFYRHYYCKKFTKGSDDETVS
jgi:hypothetical protein